MPMPWMLPTMRDALPLEAGNPMLRCGKCPRRAPADMLVDVRGLPTSLRGDAAHLCDGCVETMLRTGRIAREDFARLLGAPADVVTAARTYAMQHDPIRRTRPTIPLPGADPPVTK